MDEPVRVLLVEDSAAEAELVADSLAFARAPGFAFRHAARLGDAVRMLGAEHFDVVLLDLGLLDASGLDGLAAIHRAAPGAAIVVRTGLNDERIAIEAIEAGAQDYILKPQTGRWFGPRDRALDPPRARPSAGRTSRCSSTMSRPDVDRACVLANRP